MRAAVAGLALSTSLIATAISASEPAKLSSMEDLRWHYRPLVIFAPERTHPLPAEQRTRLSAHVDSLAERDMVVIEVIGETVTIDGQAAPLLKASRLRQRYQVAAGAASALLIGKDGGVKLRQANALGPDVLFDTIDAMPMRRREMKERAQGAE